MSTLALDARFAFENFVVGTANRLAFAAAKRVSESPGTTYNPLFIYSASGLGKTHLVTAIGNHAQRLHPDLQVEYDTLERFMDQVLAAVEAGKRDAFGGRFDRRGVLILDDVQFLAGRHRTQEELLRAWDLLAAQGTHVILTSDRPPHEIDELDQRLLTRFSGGLIVDIGAPDYETRVAIVRRKAAEQAQKLLSGVAEALARLAFGNVRELQGALNRILAVQELEERQVSASEVQRLLGRQASADERDEFQNFLADISETVEAVVTDSSSERQLGDAILRWESEGYRTRRLEAALGDPGEPAAVEALVRGFEADVERLREIGGEMAALDPGAPEMRRSELLKDPDRVAEAELLLADVRERMLPFDEPPRGSSLAELGLDPDSFELRTAAAVVELPGERYSPLFLHGDDRSHVGAFAAALARALADRHQVPVAYVRADTFVAELIGAIGQNRAEAWRQRYRRAHVLVVEGVERLAETERAQEELFHLFESLQREGAQLIFAASGPPRALSGMDDRLRTRLASGLVLDLSAPAPEPAAAGELLLEDAVDGGTSPAAEPDARRAVLPIGAADAALRSREKVLWDWPYLEDLLVEEL